MGGSAIGLTMSGMSILGLGHDVVDVAVFAEQLALPGSRMKGLFSVRELRQASGRAQLKHDGEAVHLAAKWAGKEAVLKAWEQALDDNPSPYTMDDFPWRCVEILDDGRGRPQVVLAFDVDRALRGSFPPASAAAHTLTFRISLSHDGPIASAVAMLCAE